VVVDDVHHSVGGGLSESQGRYAEVTGSFLLLRSLVYVILTTITSIKQSSNYGKALILFLTRRRDIGAIPGPAENSAPMLLGSPFIQSPYKRRVPE